MMILSEPEHLEALNRIEERIDFAFLVKAMRGLGDFLDPWYNFDLMALYIEQSQSPHKTVLKLLHMGVDADYDRLSDEICVKDIETMIQSGIWRREGGLVKTNNLVLLLCQGLRLLTEINPWYETCTNPNTDVYIGMDSLRLAENIVFDKGADVLDLCSGTGVQGLLAARSARSVISVELNPKAVSVARFNIRLNKLEDVVDLREGDLYDVLTPDERFDYIYANPPFIPMVDDVRYPICGLGGEDGLAVLNRIFDGLPDRLKPDGKAIVFCECLGDDKGVFFDKHVERLAKANNWRVNALYTGRLEVDYQIKKIADLTRLFNRENDAFDSLALHGKLSEIYQKLGATYLYSLLYKISASGDGDGVIRGIRQYNHWDANDRGKVADGLALEENRDSHAVMKNGRQIGVFNNEAIDILEQLSQGRTVREAADALWNKYSCRRKYQQYGYAAFLNTMLTICMQMESIGAIQCKKEPYSG